ncbi:class GN sortase [Microbulbifer sp. HZ11]|uniref:class GN sortase n=1 Tax=Microbulbifer sp. HZ11 TaxID=1453501 RepID=UPI00068EEEF1|nr:class GN sortase [Microbulbifer sp. HZ11]
MLVLRILRHWLPVLLMGAGIWQLGNSGWILAKAELAQYLISDAWQRQLASGEVQKPWPWADTWPVAQLKMGEEKPLVVLRGTSGQALAFGPGILDGAGEPGQFSTPRTTVIAAHRDTHFKNLDKLQPGHVIQLQDQTGRWHSFRVNGAKVVDSEKERLPIVAAPDLLLVTCYPFNAMRAGGPLRYLVHAEYVEPDQVSSVYL